MNKNINIFSKNLKLYNTQKQLSLNYRTNCKIPYLSTILNIHNILITKNQTYSTSKIPKDLKFYKFQNLQPTPLTLLNTQFQHISTFDLNNNSFPPLRLSLKK